MLCFTLQHVFLACPLTADLRQTDLAMIERGREFKRLINQAHRRTPGTGRPVIYTVKLAPFGGQSQVDRKITKEGQI